MTLSQDLTRDPEPAMCDPHGLAPFRDLPPKLRTDLQSICGVVRYSAGQIVAEDGEKVPFIGCVSAGVLRMQKTLPDGRQHIVGLLVEGDMFGRVFDGPLHFAIEAATDATVCTFARGPFEALLERSPELDRSVLLNVLNELDRARNWMMILSRRKVTARLAGFLLMLCTRFEGVDHLVVPRQGTVDVTIPISRTDLAHLLGSRPESISRALHALADQGWVRIRTPNEIELHDIDALIGESGEEDPASIALLEDLVHRTHRRAG